MRESDAPTRWSICSSLGRRSRGVLFLAVSALLFQSSGMAALADTNGPGGPRTAFGFANNACGPCTDANTWAPGAGPNIGNGFCGRCSNKNYVRSTGSCQGTDRGALNCKQGKCDTAATYTFTSTPVGGLTYAGCVTAAIGGGVLAEIGLIVVCTGVCVTAGVVTLGAACIACVTANVTVASAAACGFTECVENCNFIAPVAFANKQPCCQ